MGKPTSLQPDLEMKQIEFLRKVWHENLICFLKNKETNLRTAIKVGNMIIHAVHISKSRRHMFTLLLPPCTMRKSQNTAHDGPSFAMPSLYLDGCTLTANLTPNEGRWSWRCEEVCIHTKQNHRDGRRQLWESRPVSTLSSGVKRRPIGPR